MNRIIAVVLYACAASAIGIGVIGIVMSWADPRFPWSLVVTVLMVAAIASGIAIAADATYMWRR